MNFKRTRLIALMLLLCTVTLMFSSCARDKIDKPEDTNLEYWLLDRPDKKNWILISSDCYLAAGYEAVLDENGELIAPKFAVTYTVRRYPFTDFGIKKITNIIITDPSVYVWGLTLNSTYEEFVNVMKSKGFDLRVETKNSVEFSKERYSIVLFYNNKLVIRYHPKTIKSYIL